MFPAMAVAAAGDPPNFVPEMTFSYVDPVSGERHDCGTDCRRFEVPAGVDLEIRVQVLNLGDNPTGDPVSWDLWFDQPRVPLPPEDLADCIDDEQRLDANCWYAMMDRVDWEWWDKQNADRVCIPEDPGDCGDEVISVPMNANFQGSRGSGVYTFLVWVDRFDTQTETDEFDNAAGPVRVKALPTTARGTVKPLAPPAIIASEKEALATGAVATPGRQAVFVPSSARPFSVRVLEAHEEEGFSVSSKVGRASLEFSPSYTGMVTVEVMQIGAREKMTVEIRKVSTGEVLAEVSGKGHLRLEGTVEKAQLVDDRKFEVVVQPDQGTRGLRGTIRISYPDRAVYLRTE